MSRPLSEILRLENRLIQADQSKDLGVFEELIADNALLSNSLGMLMKKRDVLDKLLHAGEGLFSRYERSELSLKEYASTIVVNCMIELEHASNARLFKCTRVWSQIQGCWKVIAGNISARDDLLPAATADAAYGK